MYLASLRKDDFVWVLGSLCQFHRVPFDAASLLGQFPPPHTVGQLIEAARELGFKTGECHAIGEPVSRMPLPCIGFLRGDHAASPDASRAQPPRAAKLQPILIVKADDRRVLYFAAGSQQAETAPADVLRGLVHPFFVMLRYQGAQEEPVEDRTTAAPPPFGFRWFAEELLKHKGIWRDVLLASLFIQILGLSLPLFTQVVIDKVVVHHTQSTLLAVVAGLAMFTVFGAAMSWLRQYLLLHTGNRIDAVLASAVFRHLLSVVFPYFEHRPTGTLVARLHAVETIREFMAGAAMSLVLDLPFMLVFVAVMFAYSWQLTLIALGMLFLVATLSAAITPLLRARVNRQFLLGARNQAFVTEYIAGMETVKALQMEPRLHARYDGLLADYLAAGFAIRQLSNSYNVAANTLEQAMTIGLLCVGALLVMRNDGFTIGMLVAFQMFAGRMSQPMLRLAGLWQEFQQAGIAVSRLGDIMNAPAEQSALRPARAAGGAAEVRLCDVSFRYSPAHPYLYRGLSMTLKPGRVTVLTGPSGCGKSTLARILLGFHVPEDGRIFIGSHDIRHLAANELRQYFGVVPQETYLFSGSVYENVIAASPEAGFDDVVAACKLAEIHDFIESLPQGYNTVVGEHGVGLSGGQKQRLAIARAVLKRPRILIFDEATSHLDAETADQFARTVNQLKGKVTMLFIAHQLPRGLAVDEIVTLDACSKREDAGDATQTGRGG